MTVPTADQPLPQSGTRIPDGERVRPPPGFLSFCIREPSQCVAEASSEPIHLDVQTWRLLQAVDRAVNLNTVRETDNENHGVHEYWAVVRNGYGDCNDIAVTKRALLHQAGLPLHDLRLAVVLTEDNGRHVVLTVETDRGDLVMDSLNSEILPWEKTHYRWLMRQDGGPIGWAAIGKTRA